MHEFFTKLSFKYRSGFEGWFATTLLFVGEHWNGTKRW